MAANEENSSVQDEESNSFSGDENEHDFDGDDEDDAAKTSTGVNNAGSTEKENTKKRKKANPTKRKRIRRIMREEELTEETLAAQSEERERLKRLELQRSLLTAEVAIMPSSRSNSPDTVSTAYSSRVASPLEVDVRIKNKANPSVIVIDSDDEDDELDDEDEYIALEGASPHTKQSTSKNSSSVVSECIEVVSSESEVESVGGSSDEDDYENCGKHVDDLVNRPDSQGRVQVNVSHPEDEEDIFLKPHLAKAVKPHQIGGIRFLYDNLVETISRYKVSNGFGCILAHSMGLGKTLQVISFVDVLLTHTPAKKVLCIVPINTIQNWLAEFNMWLPPKPVTIPNTGDKVEEDASKDDGCRNFEVFLLGESQRTTIARAKVIGEWNQQGGVLLMGYELYRMLALATPNLATSKNLSSCKKKKSSLISKEPEVIDLDEEEQQMELLMGIQRALCKQGPDVVICDEGHRIKNPQANISQALKKIRTRRRVVMTGYPLQNNLLEYWCMVDFVRPNFLGTKQEFSNMFERPILNGQCSDSTPTDVRCMRFRAHVLHGLLKGFVQRRSQAVLKKCLPTKEEHVIIVNMSPIQERLYKKFVQFLQDSVGHLNPIRGFHMSTKIWNHPDIFYMSLENKKDDKQRESPLTILDNDIEMGELVMTETSNPSGQDPLSSQEPQQQQASSSSPGDKGQASITYGFEWAKDIITGYQTGVLENGYKMVLLMEILDETVRLGEKILVFSQSLSTLSRIEGFLSKRPIPGCKTEPSTWAKNKNYFRLDGNTPPQERERLINAFNAPDNTEVLLFMLSTRAGCLGINLTGASRVVIFDASWNPCHDAQAICRVYRYGQSKPCSIYRLISKGTMEKKIYDRQVSKEGVANRVVDELNPEANFTKQEIMTLICEETETPSADVSASAVDFYDAVLAHICQTCSQYISKVPFKHESLLVEKKELKLTKQEKKEARKEYNIEKRAASSGRRHCLYLAGQPSASRVEPIAASSSTSKPVVMVRPVQTPVRRPATIAPALCHPVRPLNFPLSSLIHAGVQIPNQAAGTAAALNLLPTSVPNQVVHQGQGIPIIDVEALASPTKTTHSPGVGFRNPGVMAVHLPTQLQTQIAAGVPYSEAVYNLLLNQASTSALQHTPVFSTGQISSALTTTSPLSAAVTSQVSGATANQTVVSNQILEALIRQNVQQLMQPSAYVQGLPSETDVTSSSSPEKESSLPAGP